MTKLASLTVANSAGMTALNSGSLATTGAQLYDNAATLGAATNAHRDHRDLRVGREFGGRRRCARH